MSEEKQITTYFGIFESKLDKLRKDIKAFRKDPTKKHKVKTIITEAKKLKQILKGMKKESACHTITLVINNNQPILSDGLELVQYDNQDGVLTIVFKVKL
jgi:hypothetical protein